MREMKYTERDRRQRKGGRIGEKSYRERETDREEGEQSKQVDACEEEKK